MGAVGVGAGSQARFSALRRGRTPPHAVFFPGVPAAFVAVVLFFLAVLASPSAGADDEPPAGGGLPAGRPSRVTNPEEDAARRAFREGAQLVEQSEWSAALVAFERSLAVRPHALTLYNIGVCQRFLGRYTLGQQTLKAALVKGEASGEMPALFVDQAKAYLAELEAKIARFTIRLDPPQARVAIEGRPLEPVAGGRQDLFVAGVATSGEGRALGVERFEVLVDPRPLVLTFALAGYDTIEIKKEPKPGSREEITVSMTEQPAQLRIASNPKGAVVRVDGVDVGLTPVLVSRPPGPRVVAISLDGYEPYESKFTLRPGQAVPVDAQLAASSVPLTRRWWFWTGVAALVAGAAIGTYFVVRPEPERPPVQAGGLGWVAEVR